VVTKAAEQAFTVAKIPVSSWSFAIRVWLATMLALFVGFWLQLDTPSSAALTVAIIAEPTRGEALDKAGFRLLATVVGVTAAIAITGVFSQARDLLLAAFAAWLGICVFAAKLFDGYRAYAAVLSGYTVTIIATELIDSPQRVFQAGMDRGAAIAVGILSVAVVNAFVFAPDRYPKLLAQLVAIHRRVRAHAGAELRESDKSSVFLALLRDIVALRPEIANVVLESSSGSARSAAARSAAVALVAELQAARTNHGHDPDTEASAWTNRELQQRDGEVLQNLRALRSATWPPRLWRAPLYRSYRIAAESGVRAALWFAIASIVLVWSGWPAASVSLTIVAVLIGLGAITHNPRGFTTIALLATPIAALLAGITEFIILDGADDFALLAIAMAPVTIGAALFAVSQNPLWAGLGRINMIFIPAILAPSNPQSYNPQAFLFTCVLIVTAAALLFAAQTLIPPVSDDKRRMRLLAEARGELREPWFQNGEAPEEATFRDASRIGQFLSAGDAQDDDDIAEMLSCFDQSAILRLCDAKLIQFTNGPLAPLAHEARVAITKRDTTILRTIAHRFCEQAPQKGSIEAEVAACLFLTSDIVDRGKGVDASQETT